jgi:hypothetical protein
MSITSDPRIAFLVSCHAAQARNLTEKIGEEVFHYTDLEALIGIVTKQTLWATDAQFLNDSQELRHAQVACCCYLEQRRSACSQSSESKSVARLLEATLSLMRSNIPQTYPYVVSFSENGDDLAQWRGYGRFGQGVGIGFQFTYGNWPIVDAIGIDVISTLYKCLYTEKEQVRLFKAIIDALLKILAKRQVLVSTAHETTSVATKSVGDWARWLLIAFTNAFPYMKSPAFETEQEVRLVLPPDKIGWNRKFGVSNGVVVPYVEVHEDGVRLPISRVVIGPSAKQELIGAGVRRLLDTHGYDVPVESSSVPFRG